MSPESHPEPKVALNCWAIQAAPEYFLATFINMLFDHVVWSLLDWGIFAYPNVTLLGKIMFFLHYHIYCSWPCPLHRFILCISTSPTIHRANSEIWDEILPYDNSLRAKCVALLQYGKDTRSRTLGSTIEVGPLGWLFYYQSLRKRLDLLAFFQKYHHS